MSKNSQTVSLKQNACAVNPFTSSRDVQQRWPTKNRQLDKIRIGQKKRKRIIRNTNDPPSNILNFPQKGKSSFDISPEGFAAKKSAGGGAGTPACIGAF